MVQYVVLILYMVQMLKVPTWSQSQIFFLYNFVYKCWIYHRHVIVRHLTQKRQTQWAEQAADWLRYQCCLCHHILDRNKTVMKWILCLVTGGTWSKLMSDAMMKSEATCGVWHGSVIVCPQFEPFVVWWWHETKASIKDTKSTHIRLYCKNSCAFSWQYYICLNVSNPLKFRTLHK